MSVLISIIIPVYNAQRYLQRCVDSVLKQDYTELEIVLVDDGSTDGSSQLCDEYAAKDKRVKVIHQENQGASIARKNGLKNAHGEFITFVDSDDWITKDYVSILYAMVIEHHVTVSSCSIKRVKENEIIDHQAPHHQSQLLTFDEIMPRFFKYEFWGFPGKLYKKSIFNHVLFPKATLSEDYYVMTQLLMNERQMAYLSTPLYFYEYHHDSLSHQKLSKRAFEEFENVKAAYDLVKEKEHRYRNMALSNLVGTCITLNLKALSNWNGLNYNQNYLKTRVFLKQNVRSIIFCNELTMKTKIVAIGLVLSPRLVTNILAKHNKLYHI